MQSFRSGPLVMFVGDDPDQRAEASRWLDSAGIRTVECPDAKSFVQSLEVTSPDLVCLDLGLPGSSSWEALRTSVREQPSVPVLAYNAESSGQSGVDAMRAGAFDYLTTPVDRDELLSSIHRALSPPDEHREAQADRAFQEDSYAGLIGRSSPMRDVFRQVDRIAGRDISVLIRGDSGTGKELIARAIHENSRRAGGPFVAINCAAIPESLQDSELFGHERGSFTGAHKARAGCFERADGGTIFLDEVAELSLGVQAKLLRVLQERRFDRVGGIRTVESDFRLITATHRSLRDMVDANRFREDLYFRVVVFEMELPALRDREGDLPLLVSRLLEDVSESLGAGPMRLSPRAMRALEHYPFPGNVRELENILQCAAVLATGNEIDLHDLPGRVRSHGSASSTPPESGFAPAEEGDPASSGPAGQSISESNRARERQTPKSLEELPLALEEVERWAVKRALRDKNGRLTEAAKALGIGRTTLYRKLEKYGLR